MVEFIDVDQSFYHGLVAQLHLSSLDGLEGAGGAWPLPESYFLLIIYFAFSL